MSTSSALDPPALTPMSIIQAAKKVLRKQVTARLKLIPHETVIQECKTLLPAPLSS